MSNLKFRLAQALTITPPPAPENDPSNPTATEAPAKGGSKGKAASEAAERAVVAAPGKMIVEAALDRRGMEVLSTGDLRCMKPTVSDHTKDSRISDL